MTTVSDRINVAIIDDDEGFLLALRDKLSLYPEIEIIGCATKYKQAKSILQNEKLDLLFLDIEMPGKNGFELLQESRKAGKDNFSVIFHTAFDKYAIQALQESAIDYILKPVKTVELKNAIERFKQQRKSLSKPIVTPVKNAAADVIALPASTGLRFMDKDNILLFYWSSGSLFEKKCWYAILTDRTEIKLRTGTSAKDIIGFVGDKKFIRINQAYLVNTNYLSSIEYSTRECQLLPPFNDITLIASRSSMAEIREKFDIL